MVNWLSQAASDDYLTLAGTDGSGDWGQPVYWAKAGDPVYSVKETGYTLPPEFSHLRIPNGAKPDPTSDSEMTVFDQGNGWVAWVYGASFSGGIWSASGGSIAYLRSNGLDGKLPESDDPRNTGTHRGFPSGEIAFRYDEVTFGDIRHAIKMNIPDTCDHVWPMTGDEGCNGGSPFPEGTRVRIKRSIDLTQLGLSPGALVVAKALQLYGAVIGDQSGHDVVITMENTVAEGRGQLWTGLLNRNSLQAIAITDLEVIKLGFPHP